MEHHFINTDTLPPTLTVPEVGQFLRIGRNNAYQLVRCGKIRSLKIGRQIRVSKKAVLDYLEGAD